MCGISRQARRAGARLTRAIREPPPIAIDGWMDANHIGTSYTRCSGHDPHAEREAHMAQSEGRGGKMAQQFSCSSRASGDKAYVAGTNFTTGEYRYVACSSYRWYELDAKRRRGAASG